MDRLAAMTMFVRVVETGSFSAVARELNTTQPTVSKNVAELEGKLGTKLLTRSTRSLHLTEAGTDYYERCIGILQDVEEAENAASQAHSQARGKVRINTVVAFGRLHIIPLLNDFFIQYPDIKVELMLNDRSVDLVEEGVDLAVRMGNLNDSSLVAKRMASSPLVTVASPKYLEQFGAPESARDLKQHNWIVFTGLADSHQIEFNQGGNSEVVRVDGNLHTNNSEAVRTALLEGNGICQAPRWLIGDAIEGGDLRIVLPHYDAPTLDISAVYPSGRHLPSKARLLLDFMAERFSDCSVIQSC